MENKNIDETTGVSSKDYYIAAAIVAEALFMFFALTNKMSFLGTVLPVIVSIVAVTITTLAVRDFFRQHK